MITFLSKSTINNLIKILSGELKTKIANEIKLAKKFSVQIDSTQDISIAEQCTIIVRYVLDGKVYERLLAVCEVENSSGRALYNLLEQQLNELHLNINNVIGCSFDGAANMSGQYEGLRAHIANKTDHFIYTWC